MTIAPTSTMESKGDSEAYGPPRPKSRNTVMKDTLNKAKDQHIDSCQEAASSFDPAKSSLPKRDDNFATFASSRLAELNHPEAFDSTSSTIPESVTDPAAFGTAVHAPEVGRDMKRNYEYCCTLRWPGTRINDPDVCDRLCIMCRRMLDCVPMLLAHHGSHCSEYGRSRVEHWSDSLSLSLSAQAGCLLCRKMYFDYGGWLRTSIDKVLVTIIIYDVHFVITVFSCNLDLYRPRTELNCYLTTTAESMIYAHTPDNASQVKTLLDLASMWYRHCRSQHDSCESKQLPEGRMENGGEKKKQSRRLPTRLLEITDNAVRLRLSSDLPLHTEYATLSHCWGARVLVKLERHSLADFLVGINEHALPKTFQEAITIARHLGLEYLWIDSLCIIQQDEIDWRKESITMSDVYGFSSVTIAASSAKDGSVGCFTDMLPECEPLSVAVRSWQEGYSGFQKVEVMLAKFVSMALSDTVLSKRGWVLQERLLSPRTLHFTNAQLFWQCSMQVACQSQPTGLSFRQLHYSNRLQLHGNGAPRQWETIVEHYSGCALTQRRDVLVALAGVIKRMHEYRHDRCLAGLWERDIVHQLLWIRVSGTQQDYTDHYTAPSWSWASSAGAVEIWAHEEFIACDTLQMVVVNVEVITKGGDPLGELQSGTLSMACRMLLYATVKQQRQFSESDIHPVVFNGPLLLGMRVCWDTKETGFCKVFCLPFRLPVDNRYRNPSCYGLVLVPTGSIQGQYRRVGVFRSNGPINEEILQRSDNRAGEEAFAGSVDHGDEKWGMVTII